MSKRSLLGRARRAGGDVLARRLVEVGAGEQPDRDLLRDLSAVHGTRPLTGNGTRSARRQDLWMLLRPKKGLLRDVLGPLDVTAEPLRHVHQQRQRVLLGDARAFWAHRLADEPSTEAWAVSGVDHPAGARAARQGRPAPVR